MSNIYYPILITVYNRYDHFVKTIRSLENNEESIFSELFIASDSPFRDEDKENVNKIREYARNISGFKKVTLLEWDENIGLSMSIKKAREIIFNKYDAFIFSEDDNIFSPFFLKYMNYNLTKWKNVEEVKYVCGYQYPVNIDLNYQYDVVFLKEFNAWGCGYWKNKFVEVSTNGKDFYLSRRDSMRKLKKYSHTSYYILTTDITFNKKYGDGRRAFHVVDTNSYTIFPVISLVKNIGQDGSGLHSGHNSFLQNIELNKTFVPQRYPEKIIFDKQIQSVITNYRSYSIIKRMRIHIGRLYHMMRKLLSKNK